MGNLTLALPDELQQRMKQHSEIRWSEVVRKSISQKLDLLEAMNKIAQKSKLTKKDVDELSRKIKKDTFEQIDKR